MPREQIWKNSQLLSMDKLLEFDEEQELTPQLSAKPILEPPKDPVVEKQQQQQQQQRNHHHHHQQQQHQPSQPKGFNTNEALNMLINIQNSTDDSKFDLIDGFLDKYKV